MARFLLLIALLLFTGLFSLVTGQVKITDGNVLTIDPNSLVEMESSNKGLLIPRIPLNNLGLPAPLSAPVPTGMLVYSSGGLVPDGFYFWNGSSWSGLRNILSSIVRISDTTLGRSVDLVYAKNDITITLPSISAADEGLEITVKHAGTHTDLIRVTGFGSQKIDDVDTVNLLPNWGRTFVVHNSNWIIRERNRNLEDILDVGPNSTFKNVQEAIDFLNEHMDCDKTIRISSDPQDISSTMIIDLPYSLTIEGTSYGSGVFRASTGLTGHPMFRCVSEAYFKMLVFDATTLSNYGTQPGEDAIRLVGQDNYHEIKDASFDGFYNSIVDSTNCELWLFECDIANAHSNGVLLHSPGSGGNVKISETDFVNCHTGVNLSSGTGSEFQLMSGFFTNSAGQTCVLYNPLSYSFLELVITNNSWNYVGDGISGFDFTRSDGRDSKAIIENNAMALDSSPHSIMSVVDNSLTTTCVNSNSWYLVNLTVNSFINTNFSRSGSRLTYLLYPYHGYRGPYIR
ncbi:MAG: hypothetical protein U0X39_15785 [Bacteroidales bacterium]